MKLAHIIASQVLVSMSLFFASPAKSAEAFWLDQYNALYYLSTFQLDQQLNEMRERGSRTLLLHADALPSFISNFIAWRAEASADMKTIAWIQKPNKNNLTRAANLQGISGIQIDDHYFNEPPISIKDIRSLLGEKQLWCSFQPRQYSANLAGHCDYSDVQLYRYGCKDTIETAWAMGIIGKTRVAISSYDDGSANSMQLTHCIENHLKNHGNELFIFKWKNQEVWISMLLKLLFQEPEAS